MSIPLDKGLLCRLGIARNCVGFGVFRHGDQCGEADGQSHSKSVQLCCTHSPEPVKYANGCCHHLFFVYMGSLSTFTVLSCVVMERFHYLYVKRGNHPIFWCARYFCKCNLFQSKGWIRFINVICAVFCVCLCYTKNEKPQPERWPKQTRN